MKKCPFCGAELNDDNLFCTECGKEFPKGVLCPHCGTSVNEGDVFCTKCGKSITGNESEDMKESQSIEVDSYYEDDSLLKKYLPYILGGFVALVIIGGLYYCSSNQKTTEIVEKGDSISESLDSIMSEEPVDEIDYPIKQLASVMNKYTFVDGFHEGLAAVCNQSDKWGFINKEGNEVIECSYNSCGYFSEGLAVVKKGGKYGCIDNKGKVIVPFEYTYIEFFSKAITRADKDGKMGFINKKGEEIIACLYEINPSWTLSEGVVSVVEDGHVTYYDENGTNLFSTSFESGSKFSEGLVAVKKGDMWGYIDKKGNEIIPFSYDYLDCFSDGLSYFRKGESSGFIDHNGEIAFTCEYDIVRAFSEGLAQASKNNKWGYIDKKGNEVISCIYSDSNPFTDGMARVKKEGKYGYINKKGEEIVPCIYDLAYPFKDGLACVKKGDMYGCVNIKGDEVIKCKYKNAIDFSEGLAKVNMDDGKSGYIDTNGIEVIVGNFTIANSFKEELAVIRKNDMYGFINKKGNSTFEYQEKLEMNEYNKYVGKWRLDRTTDEGQKIRMEVKLEADKSGELVVFHLKGSSDDVLVFEEYPQCLLRDGVIYLTKNGKIIRGKTPQLKVGSDGLYSDDNQKYVRVSD